MRKADPILRNLSLELSKLNGLRLQDFLNQACQLHDELDKATEGIYCGRSGDARVEVFTDRMLCFGWHTNTDDARNARVEYAYIS